MIGGWYGDGNNYNTCYVSVCMYDKSRNELEKVPITIIKHQIVWLVATRQIEFLIVWLHEHLMVFRTFFFFLYLSIYQSYSLNYHLHHYHQLDIMAKVTRISSGANVWMLNNVWIHSTISWIYLYELHNKITKLHN